MRSHPNRASKELGVTELKANLSSSLRRVKAGGEVIITERGLPIAKMVPLAHVAADRAGETEGERLERLARAGLIIPPRDKKPLRDLTPPIGDPRKGAKCS
jgi:prevent-host-death family protein